MSLTPPTPTRPNDPIGPRDIKVTSATAVIVTPLLWLLQRWVFNGQVPTQVSMWLCSAVAYLIAWGAGQAQRWRSLHAAVAAGTLPPDPPVTPEASEAPTASL